MVEKVLFRIKDAMDPDIYPEAEGLVEFGPDIIAVGFKGYGEATAKYGLRPGSAQLIVIEQYYGTMRLIVWADINSEEPTHVISLEGALEVNRRVDTEEDW